MTGDVAIASNATTADAAASDRIAAGDVTTDITTAAFQGFADESNRLHLILLRSGRGRRVVRRADDAVRLSAVLEQTLLNRILRGRRTGRNAQTGQCRDSKGHTMADTPGSPEQTGG